MECTICDGSGVLAVVWDEGVASSVFDVIGLAGITGINRVPCVVVSVDTGGPDLVPFHYSDESDANSWTVACRL